MTCYFMPLYTKGGKAIALSPHEVNYAESSAYAKALTHSESLSMCPLIWK